MLNHVARGCQEYGNFLCNEKFAKGTAFFQDLKPLMMKRQLALGYSSVYIENEMM